MSREEKTPTIQELQKYIDRIAPDWEKFAVALELDEDGHKIETIRRDNWGYGVQICCLQAVLMWLRGEGKQPVTWATLTGCLEDAGYRHLADEIQEKMQEGVATTTVEVESDTTTVLQLLSAEDASQAATPGPSTLQKFSLRPEIARSVRHYQQELALPGLSGQNYLVCAPTGSGKTVVAGIVISTHLQRTGRKGKVVFLVNKVPLAKQQKEAFERMIYGASIVAITGNVAEARKAALGQASDESSEEGARNDIASATADILVCTAGCVLNELRSKKMDIRDVSLMIIDECHHTHKNTDYAKIMEIYLQEKKKQSSGLSTAGIRPSSLPQIIGLTATPGAGETSSKLEITDTIEHLLTLCAHTDATGGIHTVTRNLSDLEAYTNKPKFNLTVLNGRSESEEVVSQVSKVMSKLEHVLGICCEFSRWSQPYDTWVSLQKQKLPTEACHEASRDKMTIIELLKCLSKSLSVYMDLTYDDAMAVLEEFQLPPKHSATPIECKLAETLVQLKTTLTSLPKVDNPLLKGTEAILARQFAEYPDSKAIVFVNTKLQATGICRWASTTPTLSCIRPHVITGQTRQTGLRMTKAEQEEAIRGFHSGDHNLIVATSVLEEGLDVPACNLVIRYQHVTSEISKVQTQGRARAPNSQGFTVLSSDSNKKYQDILNDEKIAIVSEALKFVPQPGEHLWRILAKKQDAILQSLATQEQCTATRQAQHTATSVELLCKKCRTFACNGFDVHTFVSSLQYVVTEESFLSRLEIREHHKPAVVPRGMSRTHKIHCKNCYQEWGVMGCWWKDQRELPVLKCCNFLFKIDGRVQTVKKWSLVPFTVTKL